MLSIHAQFLDDDACADCVLGVQVLASGLEQVSLRGTSRFSSNVERRRAC